MVQDESKKSVIGKLPEGLTKNLAPKEEIISYLTSFVVAERTNYIVLTNLRLIYFDEKHLGRFTFKSLPFQKLLQVKAHRGAVVWGEVSIKMEDGTSYVVERVSRNELAGFIESLEKAVNNIAVEPISIQHKGELLGRSEWEFNKPAEMIFRQNPPNQSTSADDPIVHLKIKYANGEITEEEYRSRLRVLKEHDSS